MSLTATIYNFEIDVADDHRQAYETLALRVARHPSESEEYFWTRYWPTPSSSRTASSSRRAGCPIPTNPPSLFVI